MNQEALYKRVKQLSESEFVLREKRYALINAAAKKALGYGVGDVFRVYMLGRWQYYSVTELGGVFLPNMRLECWLQAKRCTAKGVPHHSAPSRWYNALRLQGVARVSV
jgi:hypothetical protein